MPRADIMGAWLADNGELRWDEEHLVVRKRVQTPCGLWQVWSGGSGLGPASFGPDGDVRLAEGMVVEGGYFANAEDAMLAAEEYLRVEYERRITEAHQKLADLNARYMALLRVAV